MGRFVYEGGQKREIEDRALAHLQTVMMSKLRRGERFAFSWHEDATTGGGRITVWVHPSSNLIFRYTRSAPREMNRRWLAVLAETGYSPRGLYLVPEPADKADTSGRSQLEDSEEPVP